MRYLRCRIHPARPTNQRTVIATHCDRAGCDSWQNVNSDFPPFIALSQGRDLLGIFCTLDCCLHWTAAVSEPTDTYPKED